MACQDGRVGMRIVEEQIRSGRFGRFSRARRLRVDLHGVPLFGPDDEHSAIRWEWIEDIVVGDDVVVRSADDAITIPAGTFGLVPGALADRLREARSITARAEVIAQLAAGKASSAH